MLSAEDQYYKIIRILLKILGIWPYRQSKWTRIQAIVLINLCLSMILVQFAVFITHQCTLDLVIDVLSFAVPSILMFFMYNTYYFKSDVMRELIERIYHDWKILKDKTELNIMNDYAGTVIHYAEFSSRFLVITIIMLIITNSIPMILDVISPLNETRVYVRVISEYFVDPSKYRNLFVFHLLLCIFLGVAAVISTALAYYSYGLHICAMLKVTNYRMEIIMDENVLRIPSPERELIIYDRIVCAVDIHRRTIQYYNFLSSASETIILFAIIIGVSSLSINLFRLLKSLSRIAKIMDIFLLIDVIVIVFVHFIGLFFGNQIGQQITNNHVEIFNTVYNLPWYIAPLDIQRLLLFLLRKGHKNMYFSVGSIFNASYEGFATLTRLSISYFTVIYTIQ